MYRLAPTPARPRRVRTSASTHARRILTVSLPAGALDYTRRRPLLYLPIPSLLSSLRRVGRRREATHSSVLCRALRRRREDTSSYLCSAREAAVRARLLAPPSVEWDGIGVCCATEHEDLRDSSRGEVD